MMEQSTALAIAGSMFAVTIPLFALLAILDTSSWQFYLINKKEWLILATLMTFSAIGLILIWSTSLLPLAAVLFVFWLIGLFVVKRRYSVTL